MNDTLHDQLSGLADGPVPDLAPPADIRRRGEHRRRRTQVVSGAAALLLVAGVTSGALALDRGDPDTLQLAGTPTATNSPTGPTVTDPDGLRFDGLGPVRVGMTSPEAVAAGGEPLVPIGDVMGPCAYFATSETERTLSYMVLDGIVSRIDVTRESTLTTDTGLGIGATEQQVRDVYGPRVATTPHPYLGDQGNYLRVASLDGRHALVFETDTQHVISFRSGFSDPVDWIEGCA